MASGLPLGVIILVAATENKRGRPAKFAAPTYEILHDMERRTAQNTLYATTLVNLLDGDSKDFFFTAKGNYRRKSIAEKIGRMYVQGILTDAQSMDLALTCIQDYKRGETVKQIIRHLSVLRNRLTYEALAKGGEG